MQARPRIRNYTPQWTGPIEGYTVNTIRNIYPRFAAEYEFEDLLQEAYIKYLACVRAYSGRVTNARWFMALYKRAFNNHLYSLLRRRSRYSFIEYEDGATLPELSVSGDAAEVLQLIAELPKDLVRVVEILLTGARKGVSMEQIRRLRAFILQGVDA